MSYGWHDLVGNVGVVMVLLCYFLAQAGRLGPEDLAYSLLNGLGAVLIMISLAYTFNLSSFIIEVAWLSISVYGLMRYYARRQQTLSDEDRQ